MKTRSIEAPLRKWIIYTLRKKTPLTGIKVILLFSKIISRIKKIVNI